MCVSHDPTVAQLCSTLSAAVLPASLESSVLT